MHLYTDSKLCGVQNVHDVIQVKIKKSVLVIRHKFNYDMVHYFINCSRKFVQSA